MLFRARRAFTLLETVAVFAALAAISAIAYVTLSAVGDRAKDTVAEQSLAAVAGAQDISWRTYGEFATVEELKERESAYTYVGGNVESTGPGSASVQVADATPVGEEVFGVAVKGDSGTCYLIKQYQPRAPRSLEDVRESKESGPCTGAAALALSAGGS